MDTLHYHKKHSPRTYARFIFINFVRGIFQGFGAVIGATILVSISLYFISRLELVPIIGTFVTNIIKFVQVNL